MRIQSISLHNFRNHKDFQLDFAPGVTTIIGRNGRGKTNIVEAVQYCATLSSHRVSQDAPLIAWGCKQAIIRVEVEKHDRRVVIEIVINADSANQVALNGTALKKPREILGLVNTVVFSPEDLDLVRGEPSSRRKFLDDFCVQMTPRFNTTRMDYERALKQRNSLLKSVGKKTLSESMISTLESWNQQLVEHGSSLTYQRLKTLELLRGPINAHGKTISGNTEPLTVEYQSAWLQSGITDQSEIAQAFHQQITLRQQDELDRGVTLVGPHRDDLAISLSGMPAKTHASHGQSWSIAVAMRLATFTILREHDDDPILILDDVFAELDQRRRNRLVAELSNVEQTLITAAVIEDVPEQFHASQIYLSDEVNHAV